MAVKGETRAYFSRGFTSLVLGAKIVAVADCDAGDGEYWPGLLLDNGAMLVIQQDEEGNGAGACVAEKDGVVLGMASGNF